ncbi:hypothetical protein GOY11_34610, partial [Pseudomonas aeruginosa]|nr:hypothetical protein [Pseudomonas aeruginosa]
MKALIVIGLCSALLGGCAALPGRDGPRECTQQHGQDQALQMHIVSDMRSDSRLHVGQAQHASKQPSTPGVMEAHEPNTR